MSNVDLLVGLFRSLQGLTPHDVITALTRWLSSDCLPHAEATHDQILINRWRAWLAALTSYEWLRG